MAFFSIGCNTSDGLGLCVFLSYAVVLGVAVRACPLLRPYDMDLDMQLSDACCYMAVFILGSSYGTHLTARRLLPPPLKTRGGGWLLLTNPLLWTTVTTCIFSSLGAVPTLRRVVLTQHLQIPLPLVVAVGVGTAALVTGAFMAQRRFATGTVDALGCVAVHLLYVGVVACALVALNACVFAITWHAWPRWIDCHVHHYQIGMLIVVAAGTGSDPAEHLERMQSAPGVFWCERIYCVLQGFGLGLFVHGVFMFGPDLMWDGAPIARQLG